MDFAPSGMAREQHLQLLTPSSKDLRAVAINRNNSLNANSLEEIVLEKEEKVQTKGYKIYFFKKYVKNLKQF
jgi:hypothetical protein